MPAHAAGLLAVSVESVRDNFARYGLLDDQVVFLKGWFRDTLPTAPIEKVSILRLDGDLYESTMDSLVSLYPKVSEIMQLEITNALHRRKTAEQALSDAQKQIEALSN